MHAATGFKLLLAREHFFTRDMAQFRAVRAVAVTMVLAR